MVSILQLPALSFNQHTKTAHQFSSFSKPLINVASKSRGRSISSKVNAHPESNATLLIHVQFSGNFKNIPSASLSSKGTRSAPGAFPRWGMGTRGFCFFSGYRNAFCRPDGTQSIWLSWSRQWIAGLFSGVPMGQVRSRFSGSVSSRYENQVCPRNFNGISPLAISF